MGNIVANLMDRKDRQSQVPSAFIHKYNNYGVNNLPFSAATSDTSEVYRMKHFEDAVFNKISDKYYYGLGNPVANLRALCARRKDAPAVAFRPVERLEAIMVNVAAPSSSSSSSSPPQSSQSPAAVPRVMTHYGERVVLSYEQLWASIDNFGTGLGALVEANRSLLLRINSNSNGSKNTATNGSSISSDVGTGHIPARPTHRYETAPVQGVAAPRVAIFEETRWEWITTIFGLWTQRFVAVTVYANLGAEALAYALEEAECEVIVCNGRHVPTLFDLMRSGRLPWSTVVYLDDLPEGYSLPITTAGDAGETSRQAVPSSVLLVPWTGLVDAGRVTIAAMRKADEDEDEKEKEKAPNGKANGTTNSNGAHSEDPRRFAPRLPASNDHLALVMYTSGTTGKPKGVMHTHGSIAAGVETLNDKLVWIEPYLPRENQTYCAFLPLAHIMEFVCINIFLHRGFLVCFSSPRTLTAEFARPHGDFEEYKPLIIMAVPRIYDVLRKSVLAGLPPVGTLKRRIFDQAYATRLQALHRGMDTPYYNAKVFAKVRSAFGGRMVLMLSGGGLLSEATHEFVNVCLGLVVEGYGLTETVACGATQMIGSLSYDNCGELMKGCEIRLLDTEHFRHTDLPEPRGEVLLRGPFLFKGYYKQPELTREALDDDGWFHTGDIGSIVTGHNNVLRIVGRVKALAKNALGEYVAIEALEAIYSGDDLCLPNCACLLVDPYKTYVCAIALTDHRLVERFLSRNPTVAADIPAESRSFPAVLSDSAFLAAVTESFRATAAAAKRRPFELVRHVRLLADEWTPENGMLTAALKLKRITLEQRYEAVVADLFKDE